MDTSNASLMAVIILVVTLVAAFAGWMIYQRRRSEKLRNQFGPEYDRQLEKTGDRRQAEAQLIDRNARVQKLHIQPLMPADRERFATAWRIIQARFVDSPESAVAEADRLVLEVMVKRGYPMTDFEQRAADISVDHAVVVENYREGHAIALLHSRGEASTEDLRQAMIHYRTLFEDLIVEEESAKVA